ncbi:putative gene 45261 [Cricetulus griseus]
MEASIQLMQVIQEMRVEINRLEKENRALHMKLTSSSQMTASGSEKESEDEREEAEYGQSLGVLPGGIPTDATPAVQEQGTKHMWLFWAMLTFSSSSQMTDLLGYYNRFIIWYLQQWVSASSS